MSTLLENYLQEKTSKKLIWGIYFDPLATRKFYACLRFPSIPTLTGILNIIEPDSVKGKFRIAGKILPAQASW